VRRVRVGTRRAGEVRGPASLERLPKAPSCGAFRERDLLSFVIFCRLLRPFGRSIKVDGVRQSTDLPVLFLPVRRGPRVRVEFFPPAFPRSVHEERQHSSYSEGRVRRWRLPARTPRRCGRTRWVCSATAWRNLPPPTPTSACSSRRRRRYVSASLPGNVRRRNASTHSRIRRQPPGHSSVLFHARPSLALPDDASFPPPPRP